MEYNLASVDFCAMILSEKIREKRKENTYIQHGPADCLRPWEQGRRLSLYVKLGLHKRVLILTLR